MMIFSRFASLCLAGSLLQGALARDCITNSTERTGNHKHQLLLTSPDQLEEFDGCTTLAGNIAIDQHFTGSIVLNGVTNFTGSLTSQTGSESPVIESLEMPDTLEIDYIRLDRASSVRRVLFPRVERIDFMNFAQPGDDSVLDVGALKSLNAMYIDGPGTNLSFPSLETITERLSITADSPEMDSNRGPVHVHLPALRELHALQMSGSIASLSTPNLETVKFSLWLNASGTDLPAVELPALAEIDPRMAYPQAGRISLMGRINRIDLGPLEQTAGDITIQAETPVEIYSALKSAGNIELSGPLQSINIPNLTEAESLTINSTLPLKCPDTLISLYRDLNRPFEATFCDDPSLQAAGENPWANWTSPTPTPYEPTPTPEPYYTPTPTPSPSPEPSSSGLSTAERAAIGVVVSVIGVFAIIGFLIFRRRWKNRIVAVGKGRPLPFTTLRSYQERSLAMQNRGAGAGAAAVAGRAPAGRDQPPQVDFETAPPPYERYERGGGV
ncbi:hypothetical protein BJY04DRAFT_200122 [Aspergillus karnatakaensis]|uniref:uncharacterized protein n=1 Tax=Aspergillus karnatakaensis TaxID=1810916 RepID=UPI003CCDA89F